MDYGLSFSILLWLITVLKIHATNFNCSREQFSVEYNVSDPMAYRLPNEVVPTRYNVTILTDRDGFMYEGMAQIHLKVLDKVREIILHSDGLVISSDKVQLLQRVKTSYSKIWKVSAIACQFYDPKRQFYGIVPVDAVPTEYLLIVPFHGQIRNDVFGFYRSTYEENGETKWMAVTQFSPIYARRAFPCMDEPRFKAVFELNIGAYKRTVTSNTKEGSGTGSYIHKFVTPVISTYQLGWAIHDFIALAPSNTSNNFQMWTRKSMNYEASFALNQSQSIFPFLEEWLQIGNPISKMEQIAVPDFNFHAMENWGMITYRETVVLHEDDITPTKYRIDGLSTMTHEYAHTWFGNLVTPTFWDVAWLKEGFASFFQYFALSGVYPSWKMMDKFVIDMLQEALLLDSTNHTRTMNGKNIGNPSNIMTALDFVSYKKAASVIRMVFHVIGESVFRNGLQMYLKNKSYQAVTPFDLYKYLQLSINMSNDTQYLDVRDVIETWANQPGYPLVTISRNYETGMITMCQEPFGRYYKTPSFEWWIPLNMATQTVSRFSNTKPMYWLRPGEKCCSKILDSPKNNWIIFNIQQTGYYRINYDKDNWRTLTNFLKSSDFRKVHKLNRAALIDDVYNLARWHYVEYAVAFNLSKYLVQETDYEPWVAAVINFKFIHKMLSNLPTVQQAFDGYVNDLLEQMYKDLGFIEFKDENITRKLQREKILSLACLIGNANCLSKSTALFEKWIHFPNKRIPKNVKSFVYCQGVRNGHETDWYTMLTRWQNTDLQTEQELLLQGLGCTNDPNLLEKLLELSISDERNVRKQQRIIIVNAAIDGNPGNAEHVLNYVQSNLQRIINMRGYDFLEKLMMAIGKAMVTTRQMKMLEAFLQSNLKELDPVLDAMKQAIDAAAGNVKWIKETVPSIANYFEQRII